MVKTQREQEDKSWIWLCAITGICVLVFLGMSLKSVFKNTVPGQRAASVEAPAETNPSLPTESFQVPSLISLIVHPASTSNYFDFLLDSGDYQFEQVGQVQPEIEKLVDYFFMGITLPSDVFWVNLNPTEEDKISNPFLSLTDMGRVLLETDLLLKKDAAAYTDPRTPTGKKYWGALSQKLVEAGLPDAQIPAHSRLWIIPEEAVVERDGDAVTIADARLKVCLESEYFGEEKAGQDHSAQTEKILDCASEAMKEVIVPVIQQEVNDSKRYGPLRQVYAALILAECYKQRYWGDGSLYSQCVNQANLDGLHSEMPWEKGDFFNAYVQSITNGEYSCYQEEYSAYAMNMVNKHYFSGGIIAYPASPGVLQIRDKTGFSSPIGHQGTLIYAWAFKDQLNPQSRLSPWEQEIAIEQLDAPVMLAQIQSSPLKKEMLAAATTTETTAGGIDLGFADMAAGKDRGIEQYVSSPISDDEQELVNELKQECSGVIEEYTLNIPPGGVSSNYFAEEIHSLLQELVKKKIIRKNNLKRGRELVRVLGGMRADTREDICALDNSAALKRFIDEVEKQELSSRITDIELLIHIFPFIAEDSPKILAALLELAQAVKTYNWNQAFLNRDLLEPLIDSPSKRALARLKRLQIFAARGIVDPQDLNRTQSLVNDYAYAADNEALALLDNLLEKGMLSRDNIAKGSALFGYTAAISSKLLSIYIEEVSTAGMPSEFKDIEFLNGFCHELCYERENNNAVFNALINLIRSAKAGRLNCDPRIVNLLRQGGRHSLLGAIKALQILGEADIVSPYNLEEVLYFCRSIGNSSAYNTASVNEICLLLQKLAAVGILQEDNLREIADSLAGLRELTSYRGEKVKTGIRLLCGTAKDCLEQGVGLALKRKAFDFIADSARECAFWLYNRAEVTHYKLAVGLSPEALLELMETVELINAQRPSMKESYLRFVARAAEKRKVESPLQELHNWLRSSWVTRLWGSGIGRDNDDSYLCLVPAGLRPDLPAGKADSLLRNITMENFMQPEHTAALYVKLRREMPAALGLSYAEFLRIINRDGRDDSIYTPLVMAFLSWNIYGETPELTEKEQRQVISLSIALHKRIMAMEDGLQRGVSRITLRDLVRFNVDFSKFYLRQRGLENVFELFILTAANVYGRVIRDETGKKRFVTTLKECLRAGGEDYSGLTTQAQVITETLGWNIEEAINNIIDYADYDALSRRPQTDEMPFLVHAQAILNRAVQVHRPVLFSVHDNNVLFVEDMLGQLAWDGNNIVIPLACSGFTKRQELLGMYAPKQAISAEEREALILGADVRDVNNALQAILSLDDGEKEEYFNAWESDSEDIQKNTLLRFALAVYLKYGEQWREFMQWQDGILVKIARAAQDNPQKRYFLIFNNVSACPDRVRIQLNPVLWEQMVEIPHRGETVAIPANLNFIFTMHQDTAIQDDSYYNRVLVPYVNSVTDEDIQRYVISRTGVNEQTAERLVDIYHQLRSLELNESVSFYPMDILEVAKRVKGISGEYGCEEQDVVLREAHNYFWLRMANRQDRESLKRAVFPHNPFKKPQLLLRNGELIFDEVAIKASNEMLSYARQCPDKSVQDLLLEFYGFATGELELEIFAQMARALKYAGKVIQLEGPSGEGKTEIGRVFSRMIDYRLSERTVNEDTDLADFRGQVRPTRESLLQLYEADYVAQLEQGRNVFLYNEINTNKDAALYYWFFPEITQLPEKVLPEFPTGDDSIAKKIKIEQNNLWLFTVNPQKVRGRTATPPVISAHIPVFHMALDEEEFPIIMQELFKETGLPEGTITACVTKLCRIHRLFLAAKKDSRLLSPQTVTKREWLRVRNKFKEYLSQGLSAQAALGRAIEEVYLYMWKEVEDIEEASALINKVLREKVELSAEQTLRSALKERSPLLIFLNAANHREAEEIIKQELPGVKVHPVLLSFFHRKRQLLGGVIPPQIEQRLDKKWQNVQEAFLQLDAGLGIIPQLIRQARWEAKEEHLALLYNYGRLNSRVAPLLNEFLQTGCLKEINEWITPDTAADLLTEIKERGQWDELKQEYETETNRRLPESVDTPDEAQMLHFAQWFYGSLPGNLRIIALSSSHERTYLGEPEIDRFLPVNLSRRLNGSWIQKYLEEALPGPLLVYKDLIIKLIEETYGLYEQQHENWEYEYNCLSKADIDTALQELMLQKTLSEKIIEKVIFYTLGIGLRSDYRKRLSFNFTPGEIRYEQRGADVYLIVDGIEFKTYLSQAPQEGLLAPLGALKMDLAAMLIAAKHGRTIILEGNPGGGKSVAFQDLARRVGLPFYKAQMYADVDLGDFLGKLSKRGKQAVLTCSKDKENRYPLEFLRAYSEGGLFLLDEGAIGANSQEVISYLAAAAESAEIDLGTFHPGLRGGRIRRHPHFFLGIAQNPARTTKGREELLYQTATTGHKIWVDNRLTREDGLMLIDYYLGGYAGAVEQALKENLVRLHQRFSEIHPDRAEISPRQLITITLLIKDALQRGRDVEYAAFSGIMLSYLSGVAEEVFTRALFPEVISIMGWQYEQLLEEWSRPVEAKQEDANVVLGDVSLRRSSAQGNVEEKDIFLSEPFVSLNRITRAMAVGFSQNMPLALLEEDGASALDRVKYFCYLTGWQLYTLWSHAQMARMHLLDTILPRLTAEFDRYGISKEDISHEFRLCLGFLLRHLLPEEEYTRSRDNPQAQQVLFFNFMDTIPERQRALLNEILTTRRINVPGTSGETTAYILPEWVHIVVSSTKKHDYSSAFINRFVKIGVDFPSTMEDVTRAVKNKYPLVRAEEIYWIKKIVEKVYEYDHKELFGLHYAFSLYDIFKLAERVQLEKQMDIDSKSFNANPLYYTLKACLIIYSQALEEADRQALEALLRENLLPYLLDIAPAKAVLLWEQIREKVEQDLSGMKREDYIIRVPVGNLAVGQQVILKNKIMIEKVGNGFMVQTPAAAYRMTEAELKQGKTLSTGLTVGRENNHLLLKLSLINSIGGIVMPREEINRELSLPEEEVSTAEFTKYTPQINRLSASLLRSWQVVKDASGRMRIPRVVLLNGETGSNKTTLIRNIARIWGVPLYILDAYQELKMSDITVGLRLREGRFELGIKEFLARCGKINGKRVYIPDKFTCSRQILLVDEANASPEVLHAIAHIVRGEQEFSVEYAGEVFNVELDKEVMIILTFNPAERYSGRGLTTGAKVSEDTKTNFAQEVAFYTDKLWAPNPLNYPKETLMDILFEYHRRGITAERKQMEEYFSKVVPGAEDYRELPAHIVEVKTLPHPPVQSLQEVLFKLSPQDTREQRKTEEQTTPENREVKNATQHLDTQMRAGEEVIGDGLSKLLGEKQKIEIHYGLNPYLYRETIYDRVNGVTLISQMESEAKERIVITPEIPTDYITLEDTATVEMDRGKWYRLTTPVPGGMLRLLSYEAQDAQGGDIAMEFCRGQATDTLYCRAEKDTGRISLKIKIAFNPHIYLGQGIPRDKAIHFDPPMVIPAFIQEALGCITIEGREYNIDNYSQDARRFIYDLIVFFRDFGLQENGIETAGRGDNPFEKIISSLQGVCRHRAGAFFILTQHLGFKTRYVENQVHAFAEILVDNYGWVRVDLGGGGDPLNYDFSAGKDIVNIEDQGDFPEPDSEQYKKQQEMYEERMSQATSGKGGGSQAAGETREGGETNPLRSEPTTAGEGRASQPEIKGEDVGRLKGLQPPATGLKENIKKLLKISPNLVERFLEVFAGEPKVLKEYADAGDDIDIERVVTGDLEPFLNSKVVEGMASLSVGVTLDMSASTQGELEAAFYKMLEYYTALFYFSAERNNGLSFSISGFGNDFDNFLTFADCRNKYKTETVLSEIAAKLSAGGRTNIYAALKGIIEQQKKQPQENKMEIVWTDGESNAGGNIEKQRLLLEEARKSGIDIVFIGISTPEVKNYPTYLVLEYEPNSDEMIKLLMRLSLIKAKRGMLPAGDLTSLLDEHTDGNKAASSAVNDFPDTSFVPSVSSPVLDGIQDTMPGGIDLRKMKIKEK